MLELEQRVNDLSQMNEMLRKEKNESVERASNLAIAELFELRGDITKVQAQLAETARILLPCYYNRINRFNIED